MNLLNLMKEQKLKNTLEEIYSHKDGYDDFNEENDGFEVQDGLLSITYGGYLYGVIPFDELSRRYINLLKYSSESVAEFLDSPDGDGYAEGICECVEVKIKINEGKIIKMLKKDVQPFFYNNDLYKRIMINGKEYIVYDYNSVICWANEVLYVY